MTPDVELLVAADLHLGRHPARVPEELDGPQFSPATVWDATVDAAIDRGVDALLLAGDAIDDANQYVEAFGDLERGARRLDDAGIELVAVAGNHDHDALPELVDSLDVDSATLLGADGRWERHAIVRDDEVLCRVDGWSFPSEHVLRNPLDDYDPAALAAGAPDPEPDQPNSYPDAPDSQVDARASRNGEQRSPSDAPVVGLLHADLDARDSRYAPVAAAGLEAAGAAGAGAAGADAAGPAAWILGHLHAPGVRVEGDPTVLYPGSPQPLDPGERGTHGPWQVTLRGASGGRGSRRGGDVRVDVEQLPLATLRYDELAVDVGDAESSTDAPPAVRDRFEAHLRESVPADELELLLARVRLTGRTAAHAELVEERGAIEDDLGLRREGVALEVESVDVDASPAVDLESHAGEETPIGYLAELLLALDGDDPTLGGDESRALDGDGQTLDGDGTPRDGDEPVLDGDQERLVDDALDRLRQVQEVPAYARLHREGRIDEPDREDALDALASQARLLLDELLEQREDRA